MPFARLSGGRPDGRYRKGSARIHFARTVTASESCHRRRGAWEDCGRAFVRTRRVSLKNTGAVSFGIPCGPIELRRVVYGICARTPRNVRHGRRDLLSGISLAGYVLVKCVRSNSISRAGNLARAETLSSLPAAGRRRPAPARGPALPWLLSQQVPESCTYPAFARCRAPGSAGLRPANFCKAPAFW